MENSLSPEDIAACPLTELSRLRGVTIDVEADRDTLALTFAQTVLGYVRRANKQKKRVTMILPVGPIGQWKLMADLAIAEKINLSRLSIIQMDEYLTPAGQRVPTTDPFSFTRFVWQVFGRRAAQKCGFRKNNWIVPDPSDTGDFQTGYRLD